ncbi:hypothetical protein KL953_26895 [Mycolicibacterium goodii]|nr:hypothetical protein [Mycolicibacterium goodii]
MPARSQKGSHGSVERCALRIGHSLSAGAETVPVLVDRLVRSSPGLKVRAVPMATPEISPAVVDGHIDVGITRGNNRVVVCAGSRCDICASGVQLAQHHLLTERPEIGIADAAAYPLRLPDRAANPVIHDELSALFRHTRPLPQFRTPAVPFDMSQRALRDGLTLAPATEAAVTAQPAGLTWRPLQGTRLDHPPGPPAHAITTTSPHPRCRESPGARAALAAGLTRNRSRATDFCGWRGRRPCSPAHFAVRPDTWLGQDPNALPRTPRGCGAGRS